MRRGIEILYKIGMRRRIVGIGIVIFILTSLLITSVNASKDNFQNHPNNNLEEIDPNEFQTTLWEKTTYGDGSAGMGTYTYYDRLVTFQQVDGYKNSYSILKTNELSCSNYWAFNLVDYWNNLDESWEAHLYFIFYNSSGYELDSSNDLKSWATTYEGQLWEFLRSGNTIALYAGGVYVGDIGGTYSETPCYMAIKVYRHDYGVNYQYTGLRIDDFFNEGEGVIGTFPHSWKIERNWDNPDANGLYDNTDTKKYTHVFHTTYVWRNVTGYDERNPPADSIVTKHFFSGEIVNITSLDSKSWGLVEYNFTDMLFHEDPTDDKYGLYFQELKRGADVLAQDYFWFTYESAEKSFSGTISWDKDSYASGETARIHTNITDADFTTFLYKGYIYDIDGNKEEEWTISSADEWHDVDLNGYDAGTYFAILRVRNKNTGFEWDEAYDIASVSEEVRIEGVSYNAKNETVLGNVYVNAIQNYVDHETTTNATTGEYNISELCVDMEIQMNAAKANYTHNNFSFTPLQNGLYNIDLFLLPDENHININPPAIVGLVQSYPFYQNVSEATVNLWNTSIGLTTNNTTNSMGYFQFTLDNTSMKTSNVVNETFNSSEYDTWVNLANSGIVPYSEKVTNTTDENPYYRGTDYEMDYIAGKIKVLSGGNMSNNTNYHIDYEKYETTYYSINATKFRYEQMNQPLNFSVNATEIKYVYLLMNPIYNLTVRARSADTHATIMEFDVMLNDGDIQSTTTGSITFSVNYGIHKIEVGADGYYSTVAYVYVSEDAEKVVYLTPLEEGGGAGTYYPPPHLVEFKVQNVWGQPLSGVNVTAVPVETSMVNWSWIQSVYGYGENISQTMSGTTDSNGAVSFVMVETIKYKMYFTNESQNISAYREIYPKDDRYVITIGEIPEEKIGWWLSTAQNDSANTGNITIHYLDYNEPVKTQWVNFSIYYLDNDTLVYSHNFTTVNATNENTSIDLNASYTYKVKITAYHEDYGIISSTTIIVFVIPEKPKLPVAQELFKHLEPWQITLISMFVLICFGFIFGAVSAGTGGLIVAAMAAAFYYFGLLPSLSKEVASIVIPLILIVAVVNKLIEQRGVIQE